MTRPAPRIDLVLRIQTIRREQPMWLVQTGSVQEWIKPLTDGDLRGAAEAATPAGQPSVLPSFASTWDGLLAHLGSNKIWQPNARILELVGKLIHGRMIDGKIAAHVHRLEQEAHAHGVPLRYVVQVFEGEEDGLLPRLPFELLHHESFWFRRANTVGVRLPPESEACDVRLKPDAAVLIAAAHTEGKEPSVEQLAAHIAAIAQLVERAGFTARSLPDCTPAALEAALQDGCDALYVACHGEEDLDQNGRLALRGGDVTGRQLGEWLEAADASGRRTQAAILCACSSAVPGRRPGTMGMAQHLAATGHRAAAALGFRAPVDVGWALAFMTEVFGQLAAGASLEVAVASARRKQRVDESEWSLPLMFVHERDPFALAAPTSSGFELPPDIRTLLPTTPRPYFTARREQLEALRVWQSSSKSGIHAVLVGEGGVGKSEIARKAVHEAHATGTPVIWLERPDGDLGGCLTMMIQQRHPSYRPRDGATLDDVRADMTRALGSHRGMLVLDDVERASTVDTLTPGDRWKVLATTRRRGLVPGATEFDVEPLAPDDAVALLAKLVLEGKEARFAPGEAATARELVEDLGRLPLAIELASGLVRRGVSFEDAWFAAWPDGELLDRITRMMQHSLSSLEPGDEAAWSLTAALGTAGVTEKEVAIGLDEAEGRAGRRLFRLRQACLVRFQTATARYAMHPLARQIARSHARAGGTWDTTLARAARVVLQIMTWCRETARRDVQEHRWKTQQDAIETLDLGHWPPQHPHADEIASALVWADSFRRDRTRVERLQLLQEAFTRARQPGTLADAYLARSRLRTALGELQGAASDLAEALALYTRIGDPVRLANIHLARGVLRERDSDLEGAAADYERSLELGREAGHDLSLGNAYVARGVLRVRRDNSAGAQADFDSASRHYDAIRDEASLGIVYLERGDLLMRHRDPEGAGADFARALKTYEELGDRHGIANALRSRSNLRVLQGNLEGARTDLDRAVELFVEEQEKLGLANALTSRGVVHIHLGNLEAAEEDLRRGIELYSSLGARLGLGYAHAELGRLRLSLGDSKGAEAAYALAIDFYLAARDGVSAADIYVARGELRRTDGGDKAGAEADFIRASELFAAAGDAENRTRAEQALATLRPPWRRWRARAAQLVQGPSAAVAQWVQSSLDSIHVARPVPVMGAAGTSPGSWDVLGRPAPEAPYFKLFVVDEANPEGHEVTEHFDPAGDKLWLIESGDEAALIVLVASSAPIGGGDLESIVTEAGRRDDVFVGTKELSPPR